MKPVMEIRDLYKSFKDTSVLRGLNLTIHPRDVIYIKGRNGSGKSTLLKIMSGLMDPDGGEIRRSEDTYVGALIENPSFVPYATLKENLLFLYGLRHPTVSSDQLAYLKTLCAAFDLNFDSRKLLKAYSVGMKQKAGIIQAIMENQDLILLDEPTRGLDDESIDRFVRTMRLLAADGKTIVVTAHDYVEIGYTRKLRLEHGQMAED